MISLIISSFLSIFIFREFFISFLLGFIFGYYLKFSIFRAIILIALFSIAFESIIFQFKEFPIDQFYINFSLSIILGIIGYLIKNPLIFSSFFYISYLTKRFLKFIITPILAIALYYLNFSLIEKLFLFFTIFFFSIPFISYNYSYYRDQHNPFETLKFINGFLLGYIFLKHQLDFLIFSILYLILSFLPIYRIFSFLPLYFPKFFSYLFISLILGSIIYFYYNPKSLILFKYPLLAIGIVLLHILQIVIAFIPGHFVPFMAGYIFGIWGIFIDGIGMLVGSFTAYYIGKLFGEKVALRFVKKEDFDKFSRFINERGIIGFYLLYLIPFTPKDALCFVAGALKIKWLYFLFLILFIRIPADSLMVLLGAGFKNLDPKISFIFAGIGFILILIYLIFSRLVKNKL
ncbi:MAG: VTT domain-containing protein [candidate division WOR-3 bacterium]